MGQSPLMMASIAKNTTLTLALRRLTRSTKIANPWTRMKCSLTLVLTSLRSLKISYTWTSSSSTLNSSWMRTDHNRAITHLQIKQPLAEEIFRLLVVQEDKNATKLQARTLRECAWLPRHQQELRTGDVISLQSNKFWFSLENRPSFRAESPV